MLSADQIERARTDPLSFRHAVGRGAGATHDQARAWLSRLRSSGALNDVGPAVFVYRIESSDQVATGIIAEVALDAYGSGRIKPHEATLAKTEAKMARYMRSTRIYGNPVTLAHRPDPGISAAIAAETQRAPDLRFTTADGSAHSLWSVEGEAAGRLCSGFRESLYVIDGHHRLAAAETVGSEEGGSRRFIPAGLFSTAELGVRSFFRCVTDPTIDLAALLERLGDEHVLERVDDEAMPRERLEFGVTTGDEHFRLRLDPGREPPDTSAVLDVSLLQDLVLGPMLGIRNPRKDGRLRFVADTPTDRPAARDCTISFLPFPVSVDDVVVAADERRTMPPKSTWFAPKLPSGLVMREREPRGGSSPGDEGS